MRKKVYYIVIETNNKKISNVIETFNDLDTVDGITKEIIRLDDYYGSDVIVLDWKQLNKRWWRR